MPPWAHGNESYNDYPASKFLICAYGIHLSYGIPSLIRYFTIIYNILHSSYSQVPFYRLFLVDGYIVGFKFSLNLLFRRISMFLHCAIFSDIYLLLRENLMKISFSFFSIMLYLISFSEYRIIHLFDDSKVYRHGSISWVHSLDAIE